MDLREAQKAVYKNKLDKGFNVTDVNKEFCSLYGEVAEAYFRTVDFNLQVKK